LLVFGQPVKLYASLIVYAIDPLPNYALTKDKEDTKQLVDKKRLSHPVWTQRGSVAWKDTSVVVIEMDFVAPLPNRECRRGAMRLWTAKKEKAGVLPPRRIDVYSIKGKNEITHVSGTSVATDRVPDNQSVPINLEMNGVKGRIIAVVHSAGRYLVIDEIEWNDAGPCHAHEPSINAAISDFKQDSRERLLNAFEKAGVERLNTRPSESLRVWTMPPWGDLPSQPPTEKVYTDRASNTAHGFTGEKAEFVIGVSVGDHSDNSTNFSIKAPPAIKEHIQLFKVLPVRSFDGKLVYDPLKSLDHHAIDSGRRAGYIWLEVNLQNIDQGVYDIEVDFYHLQQKAGVKLELCVAALPELGAECTLDALVWGYPRDRPIWGGNDAVQYRDLIHHGATVFVVHPSLLQLPQPHGRPTPKNRFQLIEQMRTIVSLKTEAQILFFMSLDRWERKFHRVRQSVLEQLLHNWLVDLIRELEQAGFSSDQWALYPVDEPHGKKTDSFFWASEIIKRVDPSLRIYANPIDTHSKKFSRAQLKKMMAFTDILQPNFKLAWRHRPLFQTFNGKFWFYQNPSWPAKSETPSFYYTLGTKAWMLGAKGVGFWSYSDTFTSSAWNDFDGRRPDWAVVYEGEQGPIGSRRWKAFRKGIRGYELLCAQDSDNLADSMAYQYLTDNREKPDFLLAWVEKFLATQHNCRAQFSHTSKASQQQ
jgi:hypothetical protein